MPLRERAYRGVVEVVVVIVREQYEIDRRQRVERDARRMSPPGPGERQR
jgi:hypothetical protein